MQTKFNHVTFLNEFGDIIQKDMEAVPITPTAFRTKTGVRIERHTKKKHLLRMDTYFLLCSLLKRCPILTFIDIALKFVPAQTLINYINTSRLN